MKTSDYIKSIVVTILVVIISTAFVFASTYIYNFSHCSSWGKMNPIHNIRYDLLAGCVYQTPDGFWISLDNVVYITNDATLTTIND